MHLTSKNLQLLDKLNNQEEHERYNRVVDYIHHHHQRPQSDTCTHKVFHGRSSRSILAVVSDDDIYLCSTSSNNRPTCKSVSCGGTPSTKQASEKSAISSQHTSNASCQVNRSGKRTIIRPQKVKKHRKKHAYKGPTRNALNAQRSQRLKNQRDRTRSKKNRPHRSFHLLEKITSPNVQISRISMRSKNQDCGLKPGLFSKGKSSSKARKNAIFSEQDFLRLRSRTSSATSSISHSRVIIHSAKKGKRIESFIHEASMSEEPGSSKAEREASAPLQGPSRAENNTNVWCKQKQPPDQCIPKTAYLETDESSYSHRDASFIQQKYEVNASRKNIGDFEKDQHCCHADGAHQAKLQLSDDCRHQANYTQTLRDSDFTPQHTPHYTSSNNGLRQQQFHPHHSAMDLPIYSRGKTLLIPSPTPIYGDHSAIERYPATNEPYAYDVDPYYTPVTTNEADQRMLRTDHCDSHQDYIPDMSDQYTGSKFSIYPLFEDEEEEIDEARFPTYLNSPYSKEHSASRGLISNDDENDIAPISFANFWSRRPLH